MTFKKVKKGDAFKPNAKLRNATIDFLNKQNNSNVGMSNKANNKRRIQNNNEILGYFQDNPEAIVRRGSKVVVLNEAFKLDNIMAPTTSNFYVNQTSVFHIRLATKEDFENDLIQIALLLEDPNLENPTPVRVLVQGVYCGNTNVSNINHRYINSEGKSSQYGHFKIINEITKAGSQPCAIRVGGDPYRKEIIIGTIESNVHYEGQPLKVRLRPNSAEDINYEFVFPTQLALNSKVPPGTVIVGYRVRVQETAGSEEN